MYIHARSAFTHTPANKLTIQLAAGLIVTALWYFFPLLIQTVLVVKASLNQPHS